MAVLHWLVAAPNMQLDDDDDDDDGYSVSFREDARNAAGLD